MGVEAHSLWRSLKSSVAHKCREAGFLASAPLARTDAAASADLGGGLALRGPWTGHVPSGPAAGEGGARQGGAPGQRPQVGSVPLAVPRTFLRFSGREAGRGGSLPGRGRATCPCGLALRQTGWWHSVYSPTMPPCLPPPGLAVSGAAPQAPASENMRPPRIAPRIWTAAATASRPPCQALCRQAGPASHRPSWFSAGRCLVSQAGILLVRHPDHHKLFAHPAVYVCVCVHAPSLRVLGDWLQEPRTLQSAPASPRVQGGPLRAGSESWEFRTGWKAFRVSVDSHVQTRVVQGSTMYVRVCVYVCVCVCIKSCIVLSLARVPRRAQHTHLSEVCHGSGC
nr:uncharacterized protein LOC105879110 [Microcebus murinus]